MDTSIVIITILASVIVSLLFAIHSMYWTIRKLNAEIEYMQERIKSLLNKKRGREWNERSYKGEEEGAEDGKTEK